MSKKSQHQLILEHFMQEGTITSYEATMKLGITQLGARLQELEERGLPDRSQPDPADPAGGRP